MYTRNRALLASLLFTSLAAFGCTSTNAGDSTGSGGSGGSGGSTSSSSSSGTGGNDNTGGGGGSSSSSSGTGGSGPGCANLNGSFILEEPVGCNNYLGSALRGACVAQDGCAITVSTNLGVLTGSVEGDTATFAGEVAVFQTKRLYECTAKLEDGKLAMGCTATINGEVADCSLTLPPRDLPPGATSACCDLLSQNCGAGSECTMVDPTDEKWNYFSVCEPSGGAVPEGNACTRTTFGHDTCAPGLLCSNDAKAANHFVCRDFCAKASDCGAGEICLDYPYSSPRAGLCVPTCTPFGNDCEAGSTCRDRTVLDDNGIWAFSGGFACGHVGAKAVGELCTFDADCAASARCSVDIDGMKRCFAYCDDAHPCSGGKTCEAYYAPGYPKFGECR